MNASGLNFLAVEDHEFQRGMLMRMLEGLGATKVTGAADGKAALDIVMARTPAVDIVISDLDMPGMDGMEFMRHLGEARVPVSIILASVHERSLLTSVEVMTRAYGVTILGVIEKPVTPAKLDALIGLHKTVRPDVRPAAGGPPFTLEEIVEGVKNDEIEAFFQPKVELATGRLHGAEALARWRHPNSGIISPLAFIPILEDNHQIEMLTRSMMRQSAAFCAQWRASSGLDVTVSVNLSITTLADLHLAERVTELVKGQGSDPAHIVLEVTESATTTEVGRVLENLSRLRMKGFGLSIDDYGTGYSSMQQLMRIPFTELKIDQSFVAKASTEPAARVILESSLDMAKKLDITSVAEGVESQQDWDLLRQLGCVVAQGYLIAKPMPVDAFREWVRNRTHLEGFEIGMGH
jgi:EAL domain-containing protein (putative c-di-GMP-specific phosphodiesterase class I)/ActR/RegA family two-component response regulator